MLVRVRHLLLQPYNKKTTVTVAHYFYRSLVKTAKGLSRNNLFRFSNNHIPFSNIYHLIYNWQQRINIMGYEENCGTVGTG